MFYFLRITPANFLYAWWLSLRHPVAVWRLEVPRRIAGRFQQLKPYQLFTRDEWLLLHDTCYVVWKETVLPALALKHHCVARYRGSELDFSRNLLQSLGFEFERLFVLIGMVSKHRRDPTSRPCVVAPWVAQAFERRELTTLFPDIRFHRSRLHCWLECWHEWTITIMHFGLTCYQFLASLFSPFRQLAPKRVTWLGISPLEISDRDHMLNFAWAAQYGTLRKEDVLFVLPCRTNPAQKAYLSRSGLIWVEPHQMFTLLPLRSRLRALGAACLALFTGAVSRATAGVFLTRYMSRAAYWSELVRTLGIRTYFTTLSYSWPEKPELAAMQALGVKSVIWAYSANSIAFSTGKPATLDFGVARSIIITDEFWVWNEAYAKWLGKRQADATMRTTIRITGPLMCGNATWLKRDRPSARRQLGLPDEGVCIGVFDVPTASDDWRNRYGAGPGAISSLDYESFCGGIQTILDRVPGCFAVIKLKRGIGDAYPSLPVTLEHLINATGDYVKQGRVFMVDINIDPYLPVAACDIAIGMVYTSPVLAALAAGRHGFFFDPNAVANYPSSPGLRELTIQSLDTLVESVAAVVRGTLRPVPLADESVTPPLPFFPTL